MPKYSYPGVYVQEVPSGERSVTGVSTSITAFVGYTGRGKLSEPTRVASYGDFERLFGGLNAQSDLGYAVRQYFLNGGTEAFIVRAAQGAAAASVTLKNGTAGSDAEVLEIRAASEGAWGNGLRIQVDYASANPDSFFNLVVGEYRDGSTAPAAQELFRNLSMNPLSPTYAPSVINASSKLIRVEDKSPAITAKGASESGDLSTFPALTDQDRMLRIAMNGEGPYEVALFPKGGGATVNSLASLATALATAIHGASDSAAFDDATVTVVGSKVRIESGVGGAESSVVILPAAAFSATAKLKLGVAAGGREQEAAASLRPAQTGTVSQDLANVAALTLAENDATTLKLKVGESTIFSGNVSISAKPDTLTQLAADLQSKIRTLGANNPRLKGLTVRVVGTRLVAQPSADSPEVVLSFEDATGQSLCTDLGLIAGGANVQWYGLGSKLNAGAQAGGAVGFDGALPTVTELMGSESAKSGLYALENVDMFNLLCIPEMGRLGRTEQEQLISAAMAYAERRRAFLLVDPPADVDSVTAMEEWARSMPRHKNAAVYFPAVMVADPLNGFRLRKLGPSGTVAGIFARTDATRGVWKVPAGVDTAMQGVQGLACNLTDAENGVLNQLAVNCLRNFPVYGKVVWGARTLTGADEMVSEWKYVGVRRLSLFIEESLYRGTKWAVFEPNDEPLWSQIRLSLGSFMNQLYRQGAFQGSPKDAYFVQCDASTTTQTEVGQGVVNIVVGFAPLKPAEFVVLNLQQIAGQAQM